MEAIFECLMSFKDKGFNICVVPMSALDQRLDGGNQVMLNLIKILMSDQVIKHICIVVTQLNRLEPSLRASKIAQIRTEFP